jgi:L-amino acid N-acyltransferase YncA
MIRAADSCDARSLAAIYNHYIEQSVITFEEAPVADGEMARRIESVGAHYPWLVSASGEHIDGYAYAAAWQSRSAYRYTVETTIYCDPERRAVGVGRKLYSALLDALRQRELHSAIAGIALPNDASVALHEKLGYRKIAEFHEVGFKFGRWIDVGYWELLL